MNKLKTPVFTVIMLVVCSRAVLFADTSVSVDPQDALVMINVRTIMGRLAGNGFVIGDGTLVITAHHLVFEQSKRGRHKMAGLVSVISPYLGDVCEAEIIAADEELDLAILKIPLKGHPVLQIADESDLASIERVIVMGIPGIVRGIAIDSGEMLLRSVDIQSENLAVGFVAVRQRNPRFISLSEVGKLGQGWSGSPMLLPDSSVVAACFTTLRRSKQRDMEQLSAIGPAVTQVRHLLMKNHLEKSLIPSNSIIPRPDDGIDTFLLYTQALHYYMNEEHQSASDSIKNFIDSRPESHIGYALAANNADKNKKYDIAEQYYQKALKFNPEGTTLKTLYAQFLSDHKPDKALEILQEIWQLGKLKPTVALLMFNILSERGEYQRCAELLSDAVKVNPENAYLWINLGGCYYHLHKYDEAIVHLTKAVELLPERGPFRGQLARLLEFAGKLDESEKHFRELLNIEPDNPVVYFWLAEFLDKHRPQAREEALKVAQTALALPYRKSIPKQKIEQLIQKLQSKTTPAP